MEARDRRAPTTRGFCGEICGVIQWGYLWKPVPVGAAHRGKHNHRGEMRYQCPTTGEFGFDLPCKDQLNRTRDPRWVLLVYRIGLLYTPADESKLSWDSP